MSETTYEGAPGTAKRIRKILKAKFPETKFSVRSHSYSGGSSVDVSWTDGPVEKLVSPEIKGLEGAGFDSMQDMKTYNEVIVDGQRIHGADYIFCQRRMTPELEQKREQMLRDHFVPECAERILADHTQNYYWLNTIEERSQGLGD